MSRILESQSTQTDMARNFSRTFNLDATLLKELIRQNNDGLIQEITLALSNIKILEIPDDAVYEYINDRKISCEQAIDKRESYGQEVSIIKKVFQADAVYNIKYDDKASANIQTQITTELASKLTDKTSITSENSLVSKDLFWGVFDDQILASIRKGQLPPTGSSERKRLLNLHRPLNVEYEEVAYNVKPIQQPSSMACWATVYTMMLSWKENADIEIKDAIQRLGSRWEVYFQRDKGLPPDELSDFIIDTGFAVESPKSYLPSFYVELLKNFGPIWITTGDGFSSHARLLIGAYRSDNENINPITDNLIFEFIDPASGSITRRKFVDFLEEYEKEAVFLLEKRRDLPFRIQIIHWAEF